MAQPYIGEIRMFAGYFVPQGYQFCQGQLLSISEYEVLFQLIGTTYGGDGQTNFALPNLQSPIPLQQGTDPQLTQYNLAQTGGSATVTLTTPQLPNHNHPLQANATSGSANVGGGAGTTFGNTDGDGFQAYGAGDSLATLSGKAIGVTGGSQPHSNIKPFLSINFIIATQGAYPPHS